MNFLQPDQLHIVWQRVQEIVEQPGLEQFRGVMILLHAKNLKTLIRGATWGQMMARLQRYWGIVIDESYLSPMLYFDIAKEVYPPQTYLPATDTQSLPVAETLLWKRCCLESLYSWLRAGDKANVCQQTIYPTTLLHDSGSIGFEPGATSQLRVAGLIYGQLYNSVKEVFAAGNQYPFKNTAIETLALDPQLQKTWQHVGAGLSHDPVALVKAYLYAKARCHYGIRGSAQKSFGVREEYRVSASLLSAIGRRFAALGALEQEPALGQGEQPYFTQPTTTTLSWFRWNINKFCVGFELVSSLSSQQWVTWEHTRVMLMFLRCLRFSYGGGHPREAAGLWRDIQHAPSRRQPGGSRQSEGLGFQATMPRYSYAWFLEKVDWETMTFKAAHSQYMLFNNISMQSAYHARYSQVRDVRDDFIRVSKIQALLQEFQASPQCQDFLQDMLRQLCLCVFRKDVFQHIRHIVKKGSLEEALAGRVPLCWASVRAALQPRHRTLTLVSGKRLAVQSIEVLFAWLWGWRDSCFKRNHWGDKPYRLLFQRSYEVISLVRGREAAQEWRQKLRELFIKSHWLLPYPQGDRFIKAGPGSRASWWSSYHPGVLAYYESQGAAHLLPAEHAHHYPLEGWGLSVRPGQYMPYTLEPEQDLAQLSEGEIYKRALHLASQPPLLYGLEGGGGAREMFCIDAQGQAQLEGVQHAQEALAKARERARALQYSRRPRQESQLGEGRAEGSLDTALSDEEELSLYVQQQEGIIKEKEAMLHQALREWEEQAQVKQLARKREWRVQCREALQLIEQERAERRKVVEEQVQERLKAQERYYRAREERREGLEEQYRQELGLKRRRVLGELKIFKEDYK